MELMKRHKMPNPFRELVNLFYGKQLDAAAATIAKVTAKAEKAAAKAAAEAAKQRREAEKLAILEQQRAILLRLMTKAGLELSETQRRKVERCSETRQLDTWIDRVLTAESARDVFATTRPKHSPPKITKRAAAPKRTRRTAA
jgi:hypothetical protein